MAIKLNQVKPVNHRLLIQKLPDSGPEELNIKTNAGEQKKLTIFKRDGNFMRVKIIKCAEGTPEYPMPYKPGQVIVIPRQGLKADYTIDGLEYTFISMFDVVAVEEEAQSFSSQFAKSASAKLIN